MKSQIFEEIIDGNGILWPYCGRNIKNYLGFSYLLEERPSTLEETEDILSKILKDVEVDFKNDCLPNVIENELNKEYSYVEDDDCSWVNFYIPTPNKTPHERYYSSLIVNESSRIMLRLIKFVNDTRNDVVSREEIVKTLKNIADYASKVAEIYRLKMHPDLNLNYDEYPPDYEIAVNSTHSIYRFFYNYLTKLYYELVVIFNDILKKGDYLSIADFFNENLEIYNKEQSLKVHYDAIIKIAQARKAIKKKISKDEAKKILKTLYSISQFDDKSLNKNVSESILALENYLYLKLQNIDIHSFRRLVDESNNIFVEHRSALSSIMSKAESTFNAMEIIEEKKDILSFFIDNQYEVNSVPRKLLKYMNGLKFGEMTFASMQKSTIESTASYETTASDSSFPSNEAYENGMNATKYQRFVSAVEKYNFSELKMVKSLDSNKKIKLINLIITNSVAYSVVMLKHIGYFDKLFNEYGKNRECSFQHIADALGVAHRMVKGNFNVLNPGSKEDSLKYNSSSYIDQVKDDYDNL